MTDEKTLIASNVPSDVVGVITACQEWHADRIAQLKSLADAPEHTQLVIECGDKRVELDGEVRVGFIAGIQCALELLEKFPLTVTKPSKEFIEGCEAWIDTLEIGDCPYASNTEEAAQWVAGWNFENEEV